MNDADLYEVPGERERITAGFADLHAKLKAMGDAGANDARFRHIQAIRRGNEFWDRKRTEAAKPSTDASGGPW